MKKTLIIINLFLISLTSFGQNENMFVDMRNVRGYGSDLMNENRNQPLSDKEIESILGSQYENKQFLPSTVIQNGKVILNNLSLRYNALSDQMEVKDENAVIDKAKMALWKDPNSIVKVLNDSYVYITPEKSVGNGGYFKILADEENGKLYKKTTVKYIPGEKAATPYEKDKPASFIRDVKFYIVQNGKYTELPERKSKVLDAMSDKKSEVKKYIKENRLNTKNEEDLGKIASYYFSLQ